MRCARRCLRRPCEGALALLVALALLAPALPAAAANQLSVSVQTGFGGKVRPGTWVPVQINLTNSGPNVTGTVDLAVERHQNGQGGFAGAAPVDYAVPVTLPQHSSKQFSTAIYVPPFFDQLQVSLTSGSNTLYRQNVALKPLDPSQIFCGVLASDPAAFDGLAALTVGAAQQQPQVVYLDLPDLPTNPQLLSSLDCLIISDYPTSGMSALQQSALTAWVDNGGVLAVGTGADGLATTVGLPASLLPATVHGTAPLQSLSGFTNFFGAGANAAGPWLVSGLKTTDGNVVVADESQPLLVAARRGKGVVFMLALSLTQPPLRGWNGLNHLWSYLLSYVPAQTSIFAAYYRQQYGWGQVPRSVLTQGGSGAGPSAQRLWLALILFGVIAGPVNFLALSRLRRRDLALVTLPVLALATSAGALIYANHHRQGDVVMNQISIVRTWDGSGVGLSHSFVGVFALHPQILRLALPTNSLVSTSYFPFQGQFGRLVPSLRVLDTGAPTLDGISLTPGLLRSFNLDGHLHDPGRIRSQLTLTNAADGDHLNGSLVNGFSARITGAALVAGGTVYPLGDLAPGASTPVTLRLGSGSAIGYQDPQQVIDRLFPRENRDPNAYHDPHYEILSAALNQTQSFGSALDLGSVTFLGWLDEPVDPVQDPRTGQQAHQQTLFITSLPFSLPSHLETIPSQLLEQELVSSSYSARIEATGLSVNAGDSAAFQFTVPVDPSHFALHALTLLTSANQAVSGSLDAYDWQTGVWDSVPYSVGNLVIPNPERYFSATGQVRLRFQYKPANSVGGQASVTFSRFELQVQGMGR
jgi:hypothetical protein